jgi:TRAP-type mannitol/chloroaromatic compound transport system substrate-binding protein
MKKAKSFFVVALVFGVMCALPPYCFAAEEKPVLLKVPICFSTNMPGLGTTIKWIADRIEVASKGSLKMQVFEPGKLVPPFEILDAVSQGKVNAGYAISGYWEGKMPGASIFSTLPFGPETGEFLAWMYYGNGRKLYQEMYDINGYKVHVIPCGIIAPETAGWYTKPINSAEDFKGLRMRFYGLGGNVMSKMGASVSLLPGGEIFPALEKKVIDATEFSMPAIDQQLGFYKVAKYNYFPGWHQQATLFELLINKEVWDKMSESQKMLLEIICEAATADSFAYTEAIQAKALKENVEKHGVEIMILSPQVLAEIEKAWVEVVAELSAKNPHFKKTWDDLSAFRGEYDVWEAVGFLPRGKGK